MSTGPEVKITCVDNLSKDCAILALRMRITQLHTLCWMQMQRPADEAYAAISDGGAIHELVHQALAQDANLDGRELLEKVAADQIALQDARITELEQQAHELREALANVPGEGMVTER